MVVVGDDEYGDDGVAVDEEYDDVVVAVTGPLNGGYVARAAFGGDDCCYVDDAVAGYDEDC